MDIVNAILDSAITVWVLGISDVFVLTIVVCSIIKSERTCCDYEKMCNYKNKKK